MSEREQVGTTLRRAANRRRWQRAWRGAWEGFLAGSLLWLALYGAYKLAPVPPAALWIGAAAALAAGLLRALGAGWRREPLPRTARWLDHECSLQERLSTAWELAAEPRAGAWSDLVLRDASASVAGLDVRRLLPLRLPQASRWALLVLLLCVGLGFVPEYRTQQYKQAQRDKETVRETGRQLVDIARRTLERRKPALDPAREPVKQVGELGHELARNPPARTEALRDLARLNDKVQQQARELAKNPALNSLERSLRSGGKTSPTDPAELEKQIESLQKAIGSKEAQADALDKLQQALAQAQKAAADLQGRNAGADPGAKDNLAKALSSLARQAQDLGAALPSLEEALAALEAGKVDQVLKDLQVAERDLEKLQQMARALQQMQQQAAKLGKDLAEQLKNGEIAAAQKTLRRMVDQLKAGDLSEDQLKAMMEEVSKGAGAAKDYGKVGDLLKQGSGQLAQGQKAPAAQSLGDAANELGKMMEQLADAQDLQGMMDALKRAQMVVGSGDGGLWAARTRNAPPRAGQGGQPSSGVGTWADETGWQDAPPQTDGWDNSDVQRPDLTPRGLSDRGEGQTKDGLVPTKVKGQIAPGSPMPSITLKGVSIKGQSTVALQEALRAAQSDAQSALSHEQVPRAYQGPVKDYFSDLK